MAYGEFESFRPSESAYTQPGEYEAVQRNVALEKATYLSSMDQFYADLEEEARQFDVGLTSQEEMWETEFDEGMRQFDIMSGLKEREIKLMSRGQSHSEGMDMFGGSLDLMGGITDIISLFG